MPMPSGLVVKQRIEDPVDDGARDSGSGILYADLHLIRCRVDLRLHDNEPGVDRTGLHGLNAIGQKVEQDLGQMDGIAGDQRQSGLYVPAQDDMLGFRLRADERDGVSAPTSSILIGLSSIARCLNSRRIRSMISRARFLSSLISPRIALRSPIAGDASANCRRAAARFKETALSGCGQFMCQPRCKPPQQVDTLDLRQLAAQLGDLEAGTPTEDENRAR